MNCGRLFNSDSTVRQSYWVPQYCTSAWIVASCTPCDVSSTVSLSGQRVAARRLRRSTSSAFGTCTWRGRMACASSGGAALAKADTESAVAAAMEVNVCFMVPLLSWCREEAKKGHKSCQRSGALPGFMMRLPSYSRHSGLRWT